MSPSKVKSSDDEYSPKEAEKRMIAALKGARLAGHKPMKAQKSKAKKGARNASRD